MRSLPLLLVFVALASGCISCLPDVSKDDVEDARRFLSLMEALLDGQAGSQQLLGVRPPKRTKPPPRGTKTPPTKRTRTPPTQATSATPQPTRSPGRIITILGSVQRKLDRFLPTPTGTFVQEIILQVMTDMGPRLIQQWIDPNTHQRLGSAFVDSVDGPHPPPVGDVLQGVDLQETAGLSHHFYGYPGYQFPRGGRGGYERYGHGGQNGHYGYDYTDY